MRALTASISASLALALVASAAPVFAQHEEHGRGEPIRGEFRHEAPMPRGEFHGDIGRFHEHDWAVWHTGHWYHGMHDGRRGWWWFAGGVWFLYPYPVYPYPDPYLPPDLPEQDAPPPPQPSAWYYCGSARGYYPYVSACPEGWQQVPAQQAPGAGQPPPR